jgi:hypothetical protein
MKRDESDVIFDEFPSLPAAIQRDQLEALEIAWE